MRWYADNSELRGIKEAEIPDILLFGGIVVSPDSEKPLRSALESAKASFCSPRCPVKWNFKDLRKVYERQKQQNLYSHLLEKSQEWRQAMFEAANGHAFTIIVACVESHSEKRSVIKNVKDELVGYVFSNGLMRFALHVEETKPSRAEVILDWPDKGEPRPFDMEYAAAYNKGTTRAGIKYHSGTLEPQMFLDSVCYTNMNHSTLLQFADLVVGATREFVECALGKKEHGFGVDMLTTVRKHLRGYPGCITGRGISVASANRTFKESIRLAIRDILEKP
jgi:hypothetical protein